MITRTRKSEHTSWPQSIVDGHRSRDRRRRAAERHSGRRARRRRDSALLLASGPVGRGQLPHVPGRNGHARTRRPARSRCMPKLVPACQTPATDGTVFVTNSEKVKQARAMVEEDLLLRHPDRLPDLRQGGRVLAAGLSLRARPGRAPGRHPAVHQPPPRDGRHGHAVRRSLRDVYPLRAVHARDHRHQRADGHQPRQPRRDRRLSRLSARQQDVGQRRRSLPGRRAGRQGLSLPAARLVHEAARRRLRRLLDRLLDQGRRESGPRLSPQAAREPARQPVVDVRRRPLRLEARARSELD